MRVIPHFALGTSTFIVNEHITLATIWKKTEPNDKHHIPNYATLTHDLRQPTKKSSPFSWTEKHDAALAKLKKALSEATALAYFDPKKETRDLQRWQSRWIIDSINSGRSHHSVCKQSSRLHRTVVFTNRTRSFSHPLACEYFHIYLFWSTIHRVYRPQTSHGNVQQSTNSTLSTHREVDHEMQPYDMVVHYRPGHDKPADYLSHHPVNVKPSGREEKNC